MQYRLGESMLETAEELIKINYTRPRQTDLRRAVSSTYYALFHVLCEMVANKLVGGVGSDRSGAAWTQVYRSLNHGTAKNQCLQTFSKKNDYGFPDPIKKFSQIFSEMQELRHSADYDPEAQFTKYQVESKIKEVRLVIDDFKSSEEKDLRAFAVWVLFQKNKNR